MQPLRVRCPCCGEVFTLEDTHVIHDPAPRTRPMPDRLLSVQVIFDGGCRGNPGGEGYGSYQLTIDDQTRPVRQLEFGDDYTSNMAEYDTLLSALQEAIRLGDAHRMIVNIRGDSELIVKQLKGKHKVRDAKLKPRHAKTLQLLERFGSWDIHWQPRSASVQTLGH